MDIQYKKILSEALSSKLHKNHLEKLVVGWQFRHDMQSGFPLSSINGVNWKEVVVEMLWTLRGEIDVKYLLDNDCHTLDSFLFKKFVDESNVHECETEEDFIQKLKDDKEFLEKWGNVNFLQNTQWRNWNGRKEVKLTEERTPDGWLKFDEINHPGIDQITELIKKLKKNPKAENLVVTTLNVEKIKNFPVKHQGFQLYVRETEIGKHSISLAWNQSSVDLIEEFSSDVAFYGFILELIAAEVKMIPEMLIGNFGECILQKNHEELASKLLSLSVYELPKLWVYSEFWNPENVFEDNFGSQIIGILPQDFQIENYQHH